MAQPIAASDLGATPADRTKKKRLVEQQGGRSFGDDRLHCGMQESILVLSSVSDIGTAPADRTKEGWLVEQQGGRTHGEASLNSGMQESIPEQSSASDVSAASTDLFVGNIDRENQYKAKQFKDIRNGGLGVGHWWWNNQWQKSSNENLTADVCKMSSSS